MLRHFVNVFECPEVCLNCARSLLRAVAREWGLFAIRNVTADNEENQAYIHSLRPQSVAPSPELEQLGLEAVVDPDTGLVQVKKKKDR